MPGMRPVLFALVILLALPIPAMAYIDPVTGSFLIQGAIGAFAAILASFRSVRMKVLALFRRKPAGNEISEKDK